jgi:hypothetical protein
MKSEAQINQMIEALKPGNALLTRVRKVANGKMEIELAEKVVTKKQSINVLALLNKGDERFNQSSGARRAWYIAEAAQVTALFGVPADQMSALGEYESLYVGIVNPKIGEAFLRIKIVESTEGSDYDFANIEKTAKRKGKDGDYIYHQGKHIFSSTTIEGCAEGESPKHILLEADSVDVTTGEISSDAPFSMPSLD